MINCAHISLEEEITEEILNGQNIQKGDFIMFRTNFASVSPYGSDDYIKRHHQLSWSLIRVLISKQVSFIGIDCAGIRRGTEHKNADVLCEQAGCYVVENLDFSNFLDFGQWISILAVWFENPISTGLPVRIFTKECLIQ